MRAMRLILSDRVSGGLVAAAFAFLLVFQSLLGASVLTRMAVAEGDLLAILCAPTGSKPASAEHSLDCCATLCQTVAHAVSIEPASPGVHLGPERIASVDASRSDARHLPSDETRRAVIQPRAPPLPA